MGRAPYDATSRGVAALAGLLAATLAVLAPSLLGTAGPATVSLAVVALLLAALVSLGDRGAVLAACFVGSAPPADDAPRVLSGRPTDPTHHPLRPRAPGSA